MVNAQVLRLIALPTLGGDDSIGMLDFGLDK
jgi:hypothetical protein